jgi:hypothetical protein
LLERSASGRTTAAKHALQIGGYVIDGKQVEDLALRDGLLNVTIADPSESRAFRLSPSLADGARAAGDG